MSGDAYCWWLVDEEVIHLLGIIICDMKFLKQFVIIPGCNSVHGRNPARPAGMYAVNTYWDKRG